MKEFIQTERNSRGEVINVKMNERLRTLCTEVERLCQLERDLGTREGQIDAEIRRGDNNDGSHPVIGSWETRRRELKAESGRVYKERQTIAAQLETAEGNYQHWLNEFARRQYEVTILRRELLDASEGEFTMQATDLNAPQQRSKSEIERELLETLKWLAAFGGDAWADEFAAQQQQILDRRGTVILANTYVRLATGEYVTESRFNQLAIEQGDTVNRGALAGPYRKGSEVPVSEAEKLGLI